jgi:hypothetical protein
MTSTDSEKTVLDPAFVVSGRKRSLPWILHALEDGRRMRFDHLQAHQEHAWHLFLVRTAAMLGPTDNWDERLRAEGDIWDIHPEPGECGFFQPEGNIEDDGYDRLDYVEQKDIIKVSGTNHRRKTHDPSDLDYWLYALVSSQTANRMNGAFHRPCLRVSGTFGDRAYVSKVSGLRWPERFASDVAFARSKCESASGIRFLWSEVFQGREIDPEACHPLMVDCSRQQRMKDGRIYFNPSWDWPLSVDSDELSVEAADLWQPVDENAGDLKNTQSSGFTYELVRDYLAGEDYHIPALHDQKIQGSVYFIAQTVAGRLSDTGSAGIHRRVVEIPSDEKVLFSEDFGRRSQEYVGRAAEVTGAFASAAGAFFDGEFPGRATQHFGRLEESIDQAFFPHLFEHFGEEGAAQKWQSHVRSVASGLLDEMTQTGTDWEARARAKNIFSRMAS